MIPHGHGHGHGCTDLASTLRSRTHTIPHRLHACCFTLCNKRHALCVMRYALCAIRYALCVVHYILRVGLYSMTWLSFRALTGPNLRMLVKSQNAGQINFRS